MGIEEDVLIFLFKIPARRCVTDEECAECNRRLYLAYMGFGGQTILQGAWNNLGGPNGWKQ